MIANKVIARHLARRLEESNKEKVMNSKFLVCRQDALRPAGYIRSSNHFPMIVEMSYEDANPEQILRKALDSISEDYNPNYKYVVVPMQEAVVVQFKRRRQYDVVVENYA